MLFKTFISEIRRIGRSKIYTLLLFVFPLFSLLFFCLYFSGDGITKLPIAILDNDNTNLSRQLTIMFNATASVDVKYEVTDIDQAKQLIKQGKIYAVVIIPYRFEQEIIRSGSTSVILYNSGTNISTNGFIAKDIQTTVATFQSGVAINLLQAEGLNQQQALARIMPIGFERHILFNPQLNYSYYLAPCFMSMIVMIITVLSTIWAVSQRVDNRLQTIIGRCLPTTIMMILTAILMFVALFNILGVPLRGSIWAIIAATIVFIIVYQAIAIFFIEVTQNRHLALSLGGGYSVLAFTFSGLTFPTMAMYTPLKAASHLFPFTYYIEILVDQTVRGTQIADSVGLIGKMWLFTVLPFVLYKRL